MSLRYLTGVFALAGPYDNYGSYGVLGNLTVSLDDIGGYGGYTRTLDLKTGTHITTFQSPGHSFLNTVFCSYPDQVCVYSISSNARLPGIKVSIENSLSVVRGVRFVSGNV